MLSRWVYGICGADNDESLIAEITNRVEMLQDSHLSIEIVSISHSVVTQATGALLWTALITARCHDR